MPVSRASAEIPHHLDGSCLGIRYLEIALRSEGKTGDEQERIWNAEDTECSATAKDGRMLIRLYTALPPKPHARE